MLGMGSEAAIGAYLRTLVERQADLTFAKVLRQAKWFCAPAAPPGMDGAVGWFG